MKKQKNIFLTALGETRDRLRIDYYVCEMPDGNLRFTTGISIAEAGMKYMLSQHRIDEIIMMGSSAWADSESVKDSAIKDVDISNIALLDGMSEYDFLNYRIAEFMNGVDFEMLDIGEPVSDERKTELADILEAFRRDKARGIGYKDLFVRLSSDNEFEKAFYDAVLSRCDTAEERRWIKYHIYSAMDSFYKMHMIEDNKDAYLRFMPMGFDRAMSIEDISAVVKQTMAGEDADINLFIDLQGLGVIDGSTLISTFMVMNKSISYDCTVKGLINSRRNPSCFSGTVVNVLKSYEIQMLISGIKVFLEYGKVDMLKAYWLSLGEPDPDADRLFYGMGCIDEGICLCNVDLIACGIDVIRKTIQNPKTLGENKNIYLDIIVNAIKADYGCLLEGDEVSIPELLRWSHRKGLYQQTLTIIESKVPEDMVRRGIYYYARDEEDIKKVMKEFNYLYWLETVKMRWAFNDIEHYFIKNYGRAVLDHRQKPDFVARDYARLRIAALRGSTENILPAYSELDDDRLLYKLLLSYYRIGNLRNQVNHASVDEPDMDAEVFAERKDIRDERDSVIKEFISLYSHACRDTRKKHEPMILSAGRMRAYVRHHELKPLIDSDTADIRMKNTYSCNFNGKEVRIDITMFKNDD